nr:ribonuclease H-like domain-containing protein [Tanacetum cinerariifolium]
PVRLYGIAKLDVGGGRLNKLKGLFGSGWSRQKRWGRVLQGFGVKCGKKMYSARFKTLLSQLEIHGAGVSHEDANQKFLRSIRSSWSQVTLIIRTNPGLDTLSFDDLYNNIRVFKRDVKGTTASTSNRMNVAFVSTDNTSNTNDVAMISMKIKKFHKRTGRKMKFDTKDLVGFDKTKVECFNCHKLGHFARDCRAKGNQDSRRRDAMYNRNKTRDNGRRHAYQDDLKALLTIDGEDIDWSGHVEEDTQNYAMMAYSSSNSGSDNEVKSRSKASKESYARLKKLYDEQREKLGDASVEITAYTLALKKEWILRESQEKNQKPGNNGHKNGKKNDTLAIRVKLDFDPRDEIFGMESMIDQMAEIIVWVFLSRKKHTPKG